MAVEVGRRVHRGDVIGTIGNSGNSTMPHLHFHLMDGPDPLRSQGVPFVFDSMADRGHAGEIDAARGVRAWNPKAFRTPESNRLPTLDRVVDFAE